MTQETSNEKDSKKKTSDDDVEHRDVDAGQEASNRLAADAWSRPSDAANKSSPSTAERVEQNKPFAAKEDAAVRENVEKLAALSAKSNPSDLSQLRKFESFIPNINNLIKISNEQNGEKTTELDRERFSKVVGVIEKYKGNQNALDEAIKKDDKVEIEKLLKEQAEIKKQMESKEFRAELDKTVEDFSRGFNALRGGLGTTYDGLLKSLVEFGRKMPLEQLPQDLPTGLKGFAVSNEQFKSMVEQGQFKLPERKLAATELPTDKDFQEIGRLLRFTDAAQTEVNRGKLEQQWNLAKDRLGQLDASGEKAKNWFPEDVSKLTDEQIEKRLAAATPWIQKGLEVQRYAELHHRLNKMISDQFNWPSWLGGIPSKWDSSALETNKDLVSVNKDAKTGKVDITIKLPDSLDRNDSNTETIRRMDDWLAKYKGPVDQVLGQIDKAKGENNIVYWGDIKTDVRVDKDGNMVEKGWKDSAGRQVFQEADGRKFRFTEDGTKQSVPSSEKLTEQEFRLINGKTVWVEKGEEINDVNVMSFRTDAKEVKGPNGEPLIEIKQVQTMEYAHLLSYQGIGWVSEVKTMGGDIKAEKLKADATIAAEKGAVGGRREGKAGDYLVTLSDGRQQFVDATSFEKLYRAKDGKPGEFEEKPKTYKPDDWVVVYRTDSGMPQPTLMQAKDVPSFCSSQAKWHYGSKIVTAAVDAAMLISGVAEVRAAMVGVEAAAGTAAKLTTMQVLGKALLTNQGAFGAFHAGLGATGFLGQGIENIGPVGKTFMQVRAFAMIADLGYTAIGRPFTPAPFAPTAEQIAGTGSFSRALLNFNRAFNEVPMTQLLRLDKAADYLGKFQAVQKVGSYLSPFGTAVGKIPFANKVGNFAAEASLGRVQSLGADVFFLTDIGMRQIPGIYNRAAGVDKQAVQQNAALERRWVQASLPENQKTPSSFDKQTMLRIDAFKSELADVSKLPAADASRVAFNKKLIDTVKNENADAKDRFAAAFALVELNANADGKLPEKISAADSSIDRTALHKFVDSQRYLQAKEVLAGYQQNLKVHVSPEVQAKLDKVGEQSKAAFSDNAADRDKAMSELISTFNSSSASPEEKLMAASAILFARRRDQEGKLSETVTANGASLKAQALVDFLYANSQSKQGSGSDIRDNAGHMRLYAGDMLLRLDTDKFSAADMSQICLSIVNDTKAPADPAAKEKWMQLKMQAMVDANGMRLGDLYELMKTRIEPEIAGMSDGDLASQQAKGKALGSLQGRDSEAIRSTLEGLRNTSDPRLAALASYMLYAANSPRPTERIEDLARLQKSADSLKWPQSFDKQEQERWAQAAMADIQQKLSADLPGASGEAFDKASWNKFRAAEQLIAKNTDLKANPQVQAEINKALMTLISGDNPALAARVLPILMGRMQAYQSIFKQMKPEEMTEQMKTLRDGMFASGAILDTIRENSIDLLKDSSNYSTYTSRVDNLSADLQKMKEGYEGARAKMTENERAEVEAQIAELSRAHSEASAAPVALKKALLASLSDMNSLAQTNPLGAAEVDRTTLQKTVQDLALVSAERPETISPELRAQAIKTLGALATDRSSAGNVLAKALADDPSPMVRKAAVDALKKVAPDNLQALCLKQLTVEKHPEVAKALREVEFQNRRPDVNSKEYQDKFNEAKIALINQAAHPITGSEAYLKANEDLKFLDGNVLRGQAYNDLKDLYFNSVGGFFRFAWEGESGVDKDHAALLEKYAGYMRKSMDALGTKAATDDQALNALVYIALSNGRPLLKDDRSWGTEAATQKLKEICQNASPERAKQIAWSVEQLLLHQPSMSAKGRQNVLDALKSVVAKPGQGGLSDDQVSTLLATALQRELRNTPAPGAKDFAEREKLQLDLVNTLSEPRFRNKNALPILEAIASGTPKFTVNRGDDGNVNKVQYSNGTSRELVTRNGVPVRYVFRDSAGKEDGWTPDASKPNTWYRESDKERKAPWTGTIRFDNKTGDYITESGNYKSVLKPSGGTVETVDGKVSKVTYPDGSNRLFEPPGENFAKVTFTEKDGKTKQVLNREGNTNTFFAAEDSAKKTPLQMQSQVDANTGDYVTVVNGVRTVERMDGSKSQIKDGVMSDTRATSSIAYSTSLDSVRAKAQALIAQMADRSDSLRLQAVAPDGFNAERSAKAIADELINPNASSERVGRAIALSGKLPAIADDNDPRRAPLAMAARDGHELVRLMAARELARSSNEEDRKLAYSVLSGLEKQGSRQGYVAEAHELIGQIMADTKVSATDKQALDAARQTATSLDGATYRADQRTSDLSSNLDYQDAYERAVIDLKENALKSRNLAQYQGSDNWFAKSDKYKLLDIDKLVEGVKQAVHDAYPGPIAWVFTSQATIDRKCKEAADGVRENQRRQFAALGEEAKLAGDAGKQAREALASIVISQGQPFAEGYRNWAIVEAAVMMQKCIKDGHPGARDMVWAVQAALVEEPSLNPVARSYLISAIDYAKERGILDSKQASITVAAGLESEFQGMPPKTNAKAYADSISNQKYAIALISNWGNVEATPVLDAMAKHHPDAEVRRAASDAITYFKLREEASKLRGRR